MCVIVKCIKERSRQTLRRCHCDSPVFYLGCAESKLSSFLRKSKLLALALSTYILYSRVGDVWLCESHQSWPPHLMVIYEGRYTKNWNVTCFLLKLYRKYIFLIGIGPDLVIQKTTKSLATTVKMRSNMVPWTLTLLEMLVTWFYLVLFCIQNVWCIFPDFCCASFILYSPMYCI